MLEEMRCKILLLNLLFKDIALNSINNDGEGVRNNSCNKVMPGMSFTQGFAFDHPKKWNTDYSYKVELLSCLARR